MFISINDCKLFFDVYGSKLKIYPHDVKEKPTLLVLHGGHGMADHTLYVEFWSQFSDVAQVIFLDQRGCGRSDKRHAEEWNLHYWAEDIFKFCQILGIDRPILAGVSMGGHVICEYISRYPNYAGGFIFCNTEARLLLEDICVAMLKLGGQKASDLTRQQFTSPTPQITEAYQKECVKYYARNAYTPEELSRCKQRIEVLNHYFRHEAKTFNYLKYLNQIQCPTLFMVGEESPLHPPVRAYEMAEQVTSSLVNLHLFKNAGAPVYKDSPEEAFNIVKSYIEKYFYHD